MALIKNPLSGGGSGGSLNIINGIIEQYKAESGTISANTFVEFVDLLNKGKTNITVEGSSYDLFDAVSLDNDKVLVIWKYASNSIYGIVLTIADGTIDNGGAYALTSSSYSGQVISAVKLSNNKVFIAHSSGTSSSDLILYGMVCTISGTTVTAGTDTNLTSGKHNTAHWISPVQLSDNKVFIAHSMSSTLTSVSSSYMLYGVVCTISGTTITRGSDTSISINNGSGTYIAAAALSDSSAFVSWLSNYGVVCTISGTSLTVGTSTRLSSKSDSDYRQSIALSSNKVLLVHRARESNQTLYDFYDSICYIICSISGDVMTVESDERLAALYGGYRFSSTLLSANTIFVTYSSGYNSYLQGMVCTISGNMLDISTETEVSGYYHPNYYSPFAATTSSGYAFLVWGQKEASGGWIGGMYAKAYEYSPLVKIATNRNSVRGITSTACTDATAGDVWVLNTSESE